MSMPTAGHLVIITGATGSGKTALSIELAKLWGCDVISADSRQIYKDMPITTAQPSVAQLADVRHHFIAMLDVGDYYSAARYESDVMVLLGGMFKQTPVALMCGGSMMYIDAVCHGIDEMPTVRDDVRRRVMSLRQEQGDEGLLAMLQICDPVTYERIDRANMRRVMHALEISLQAGVPYSTFCRATRREREFGITKFMIDLPRDILFERINRRVDDMVASGMEDEARKFYPLRHLNALNTVGFKEWFMHFDGIMDREATIARIKKNTRVYAKKQLTWLARDKDVVRLDPTKPLTLQVIETLRSKNVEV